jgi:DnaA family protein
MSIQLTLPFQLHDDATFANFYPNKNEKLLRFLKNQNEKFIYLWGHKSVGCTHLLQASCRQLREEKHSAIYLPLAELANYTPDILDNLETTELVCLDDIQCIAGKKIMEEAIFNLFNRLQLTSHRLLIAGKNIPQQLNLQLLDLTSRLSSGLIFQVKELEDEDKFSALQLRAKWRGLELSRETGEFLLNRMPRDFSALIAALEKLDTASLTEQRKLTIPFVKTILEI